MENQSLRSLMDHPSTWAPQQWIHRLNMLMGFLMAEDMAQAREITGTDPPEIIAAIESLIIALLTYDVSLDDNDELVKRRSHLLNSIKGMQNYAKMIQMDRIGVIKVPKTPH